MSVYPLPCPEITVALSKRSGSSPLLIGFLDGLAEQRPPTQQGEITGGFLMQAVTDGCCLWWGRLIYELHSHQQAESVGPFQQIQPV